MVGANRQFEMMTDQFFAYDSSITVPLGRKPVWPYTLHYLMPHKCSGNHQERRPALCGKTHNTFWAQSRSFEEN